MTFSTEEIANFFGVSDDTVRSWIRTNQLEALNVGTEARPRFRITDDQRDAFIRGRSTRKCGSASDGRRSKDSSIEEIVR